MTRGEFVADVMGAGPGLNGYAYRAALYCPDCARRIAGEIPIVDPITNHPGFCDSEQVPQPVFFGESDSEEHCDDCGLYLYGSNEE